jgi:hypothetical protein
MTKFAGQLSSYIKQSGLSLRKIGSQAGIPHQTLYNWVRGSQPRLYAGFPRDIFRLGTALHLTEPEISHLLRLAGVYQIRPGFFEIPEVSMGNFMRIPKGWTWGGDAPQRYEMGIDPNMTYEDRPCLTIKSLPDPTAFGAMFQTVKAEPYRGQRLRFSAAVRAAEVEHMAALWMRVGGEKDRILAFDNMRDRPIAGTSDWTRYAVVLDVAQEAETIGFGIFLALTGQVWMADVRLEAVGLDVPTTDLIEEVLQERPVNLDFQE